MIELSSAARQKLRAQAHALKPIVSIAANGLSNAVLKEIQRSLNAHELLKIKVYGADAAQRKTLLTSICEQLDAAPVQQIGNMLTIWRARDEEHNATEQNTAQIPTAPLKEKSAAKTKSAKAFSAAALRAARISASRNKPAVYRAKPR